VAVTWKTFRSGLAWIVFSPLMFLWGVMADSTSSNMAYDIQVLMFGTWSVLGVISGFATIADASWAGRVQIVLLWAFFGGVLVFGAAVSFHMLRLALG
jgi:hypothetical protein